jgi:ubiquinone/menaquinone biosynthesis C-methylase UbiE
MSIIRTCEPLVCCDPVWEQAYLRFETPAQERQKFRGRLRRLGAEKWPRNAQVVEIFCGRGNGLCALAELGFTSLEGVDLSERLLRQYEGNATLYVADCRKLPFSDASRDIVIVQGGLHHLPRLPEDLEAVLAEVRRVLRPGGRIVIVEPWLTTFLRAVHFISQRKLAQRCWGKFEAFATMMDRERATYFAWLTVPETILRALDSTFHPERKNFILGKLEYVGIRS